MSITFTDQLDKPSEITTIPNQLLRPVFGALYGFDVPVSGGGGTPAIFNVTTRDTEANILASTPTNPSGEVNIAFGTDTKDFYIYNGSSWYIYNDTPFNQYSVSFDGSDDFATFTPGIITATTSHTFSLWLNVNAFPTSGIGFALISPMLSCLTLNSDNDIIFETRTGSNYAFGSKEVITNASEDTWYHLVVVKQANTPVGSTTFTYYVDGSSVGTFVLGSVSNTYAFGNSSGSSQLIHLGKYSGGGYFTNILIDEMAIFTSALDSTAISSIYNGGVPGDLSSLNPRNWYRMGDGTEAGSGTTVYDMGASSGTTTDITLTNGPTFSTDVPT